MKKLLKYLSVLSVSCALYGSEDTDYYISEENDSASIKKTSMGTITPAANPVVKHGVDAYIFGDFIYWTTRVDNLLSAQKSSFTSSDKIDILSGKKTLASNTIADNASSSNSINHHMSPGFKVGAGINFCHDSWDSLVRYTWLHGKASAQNNDLASSRFRDFSKFVVFNEDTTTIGHESINWNLHFNVLDWELGRAFYISQYLILRPTFGLKGSWQKQYHNVFEKNLTDTQYSNDNASETTTTTTGSYTIASEQTYWGVGIRPGINTSWLITKQFSIYGDAFVAALWSYFDNTRKDSASQTTNDPNEINFPMLTVTNVMNKKHTLCPVLELALGLRWETLCSNDDYRIRLQAGWEEQVWFNQNQFLLLNETYTYGNLSLQGFTLEARIDF